MTPAASQTASEILTQQFYDWERYGRGWFIWDEPVALEPPFRPFTGHHLPQSYSDDGRVPGFLNSLIDRWTSDKGRQPMPPVVEIEHPDPDRFVRDGIVELQIALPSATHVSREHIEQLIFSLGHCRDPISFEIVGSNESVIAQFAASAHDAPGLQQQLEANFPEGVFVQHGPILEHQWNESPSSETLCAQFGLAREFMLPIATTRSFNIDPQIGITGALSKLNEGEIAVFQVVFQRVRNPWGDSILRSVTDNTGGDFFVDSPGLVREAKNKVSRPLYAAVMRIGVKTADYKRTVEVARDLAGALAVFSNPEGNEFIPLENQAYTCADHEDDLLRRQSRRCGMLLNSDELISLVHLPSASVRSPKFKRQSNKSKEAPKIACQLHGILLGQNHHAGRTLDVRLAAEQRVRHAYVIGASGTGKSTFLLNLIRQDIENGEGLAVFDPHGDLIDKIIERIPRHRIGDVVLLDPSDEDYSVGFNILSAHTDLEKNLLASDLVSVFQRLSTSWGDQMGSVFHNAILAFLESNRGGTLADLRRFLIEPAFRNAFLETVQDPDIVYYWKKAFGLLSGNKSIGSVLTRLDTFLSPKPIRYMVSQKENRLDFADIMDTGKIFLAKLSQGTMGKENSYLMGSLLVAKFHQAAMGRATIAERARKNFWLYLDEFHNFITPSMAEILSGARKYRVGLILAHQELRQLHRDSDVASAVLSQPFTRICFRVGDDDARKLGAGFSFFEDKDLQSLPNFEAICRIERADYDFNLSIPAAPSPNDLQALEIRREVVTASRKKYAISRSDIEAAQAKARSEGELKEPLPIKREKAQKEDAIPTAATVVIELEQARNIPPRPPLEEQPKVSAPMPPFLTGKGILSKAQLGPVNQAVSPVGDRGIGGNQHNLIRQRIEAVAIQLGYTASRESPIGQGQKIDLVLQNTHRSIACEIAITTTIDHEVGNVAKCVKGGFRNVAVLSTNADRLEKIKVGASASLSPAEAALIGFYQPDSFITHLRDLSVQDAAMCTAQPNEGTFGKYKIRRRIADLTNEEVRDRESTALKTLAEAMQKRKK